MTTKGAKNTTKNNCWWKRNNCMGRKHKNIQEKIGKKEVRNLKILLAEDLIQVQVFTE